ncbi:uncharacterized protein LOC130635218 [Hydractinia symbiolongicarpus]|uniref:uncharacterized protein LOC130635218 n=1 Tax=Hydractinia symbiolongicarpus TaxID=13093 RepID=UPI00254DA8AF|nr:uncharacterized protein LOC130635218 [Hydractinia symbiolongicarpus]XP_057300663.1 uncharacterized protein LOC130635218 [Hydractinia symbiolongicarpus]XP_057300665.1 uncharacterized protein LOC130635218 [Hydractinia symbiolongicarpus]
MEIDGILDNIDIIHKECLKFCFHGLIQKELDDMIEVHNTHRIRPYPNQECPSGRPDIIYAVPETYGSSYYKININQAYLTLAKPYTTEKNPLGCNTEFEKVALQLMINKSLTFPNNADEAKKLFVKLIEAIDNI